MRRALLAGFALAPLAGCDGIQSMTGGDGFHAQQFNDLFSLFMIVTGLSYLLVFLFLGAALLRRNGERLDWSSEAEKRLEKQPGLRRGLIGWVAFIVVGLTVLTIASYWADRSSARAAAGEAPVRIVVTANQWWWDVKYGDPLPSNIFHTANELHLPVGMPAEIELRSNDVIHSFWVPNLAGKQDLIPGRVGGIRLIPQREGIYRGECAEFCGMQHAHMALDVTVESPEAFAAWLAAQRRPAPTPTTLAAARGHDFFMARPCAICHSITGTPAFGRAGPDLTHLASRRSIAAGTYPMTRGHLYAWVADPQSAKPGNRMPVISLDANELHAVIAYLETLK
jgi:cytochrome c oxidase subunit II